MPCKRCQCTNGRYVSYLSTPHACATCYPAVSNIPGCPSCASLKFCPNAAAVDIINQGNNSDRQMQQEKNRIIQTRLSSIEHLANPSSAFNIEQLISTPTEEEYKSWFQQMSKSELTLTEQKNLLQNVSTSLLSYNNLSLDLFVKSLLYNNLGSHRMLEVTDAIILKVTENILNNIILNIILLSNYGEETNKYTYSEWFNLLFQYNSLMLSKMRYAIPSTIHKIILEKYV